MLKKTRQEIEDILESLSEEKDEKKADSGSKKENELQDGVVDYIWGFIKNEKINFPEKKKGVIEGKVAELAAMIMSYAEEN